MDGIDETVWMGFSLIFSDFCFFVFSQLNFCSVFKTAAKTLRRDWIQYIVGRNLLTMALFFGFWHIFLYGPFRTGPLLKKLGKQKFNLKEPSYPVYHDAFFTTIGFLVTSAYEV